MPEHKCLNLWALPLSVLQLPPSERLPAIRTLPIASGPEGFKANEHASEAPMSLGEELMAIAFLGLVMGGPLFLAIGGLCCVSLGSWRHCGLFCLFVAFLALHPLPDVRKRLSSSRLSLALYKYFSYRWLWSGDDAERTEKYAPFIGAGPPHGVMPFANLLSIPAINACTSANFVGVGADVVFYTPFLRYLTLFGVISASAGSIMRSLQKGGCPGVVPDGIAGIFRLQAGGTDEVVFLRSRKGLAKLALKTGRPIVPVYSIGNTQAFSAWFDPFGLMERASRAAQAAIFLYWGRGGLPIPRRTRITMLLGAPMEVEKTPEPTQEQVDALHDRLIANIVELFDTHKAAVGWGHKKLRVV